MVSILTPDGRVRFAVIGVDHPHIHGQVRHMLEAGAELVSFFAADPALVDRFRAIERDGVKARTEREILEDPTIDLVLSAGIPSERADLGVSVMEHGKDFMTDKPGFTTLAQLERVKASQRATGQIYSVCFSEHFDVRAVVKAGDLVQAGAIGRVIQTIGLGPHKLNLMDRPPWFFDRARYGGILNDIGSHQVEQFLFFTHSTEASVVFAQVANYGHPDRPGLEDWGEMSLIGDGGHGYVRVDWFTPEGLEVFGDGRLIILGTDGYIEIRKYVDPAGRPFGNHLFLVNRDPPVHIDCSDVLLPYGRALAADIRNRTETAIPQARTFLASELALRASDQAVRRGALSPPVRRNRFPATGCGTG